MLDPQKNVMPDLQLEIDRLKAENEALKVKINLVSQLPKTYKGSGDSWINGLRATLGEKLDLPIADPNYQPPQPKKEKSE